MFHIADNRLVLASQFVADLESLSRREHSFYRDHGFALYSVTWVGDA
jgi:hypothetical protein